MQSIQNNKTYDKTYDRETKKMMTLYETVEMNTSGAPHLLSITAIRLMY